MAEKQRRAAQATVVGDSDAAAEVVAIAERVGTLLADHGITLITGGRGGVMEAASRGAATAGGITVGIVPETGTADANQWCTVAIPTGLGNARNVVTALAGDFLIVIGGGAGTLSEMCFAWIHGRPILTLEGCGGWSDRVGAGALDQRTSSTINPCADLRALEQAVLRVCRERNLRTRSKVRVAT